jgi:pimeloyl-ACP methyl ester carboxylesterase
MKKRYLIAGAYAVAGAALGAKLLSRPRDIRWEEHRGELPHAERSRFVDVEGVRVHYQEAGRVDAPPVILVHGFCASTFVWSDVLLPLAEAGLRVIAPDLAGYGFSDKPRRGEYTIEAQARLVVGLMEGLGIERAILVGSSYGGAVASLCALDYPERVERLVLVDAVINDDAKRQPLLRLAAAPLVGDLISPLLLGTYSLTRWRMRKVYGAGATWLLEDERMRAHHRPLRSQGAHRAVIRTLRRWSASRVEREAHLIRQPTLLIWGEDDLDIPLEHGKLLFERIPDARLIVFRRCGHLPQEEYPQEFTKLLVEFCKASETGEQATLKRSAAHP